MLRTPLVVVAATAIALGAVGLGHAGGSPKPLPAGWAPGGKPSHPQSQVKADTICDPNSVLLFSARGSGDEYGAPFRRNRIGQWTQDAGHVLGKHGWSVRDLQAIYSAPSLPLKKIGAALLVGAPEAAAVIVKDYRNAAKKSWRSVRSELVDAYRRCPSRPILIAGYSQGGILLRYVVPSLPAAILHKIVSVDLIADPTEQAAVDSDLQHPASLGGLLTTDGLDTWAGAVAHVGTGFRQTPYPRSLRSHVYQYCVIEDLVCNATSANLDPTNLAVEGKTHASYPFGLIGLAAAERLGFYGQTVVNFKTGTIGPLRLNRAGAAAVTAVAGKPDFQGVGDFYENVPHSPVFHSLGYGCSKTLKGDLTYAGASHGVKGDCKTVYYLSGKPERLSGFWTSTDSFRTAAGTYPGMSQAEANQREGVVATAGCLIGIGRESAVATLFLDNEGGVLATNGNVVSGGKVGFIALESRSRQIGLLFC